MKNQIGWLALACGAGLVFVGQAVPRDQGFLPWSDLIVAHGIVVAALGTSLSFASARLRLGTRQDWRNRFVGMALAITLSVLWRVSIGVAHGGGTTLLAWFGMFAASLAFLVPALSCWAYVFTTFLPWTQPHSLSIVLPTTPHPAGGSSHRLTPRLSR